MEGGMSPANFGRSMQDQLGVQQQMLGNAHMGSLGYKTMDANLAQLNQAQGFGGLRGLNPMNAVAGAVGATPSAVGTSSPMDQIAMGQINPNFVGA